MATIDLLMKDGTKKNFPHQTRAGGSYSSSVRYEGAFVIIKDIWGNEQAYPAGDIAEIKIDYHTQARW